MRADFDDRSDGQRVWLAGAAALLAVIVLGGGWLGWRGLASSSPTLTTPPPATGPASGGDELAFGAPVLVDGVPWNFPLTPEGAAGAAVTAVAATGQSEAVFDAQRFSEVAAVVFTEEAAHEQAGQVASARTEFELSGWAQQPKSRRMYFLAPLAVRLVAYDTTAARSSATVEVWAMTLVGVGDAGGAVFTTSTVELHADDPAGTWSVSELDSVEGPIPMVAGAASAPGRTRAFIRDALATMPLPLPINVQP